MATQSTVRITKRVVDELPLGQTIWDSQIKGFGIRCQGKNKTYVLKTKVQGHQRWITIGRHGSPWTPEKARDEAMRQLGIVVQGLDPTRPKMSDKVRMKELCARYLEQYAIPKKKASSVSLDRKNIDNHVLPLIGKKFVDDIKTSDIESFKNAVREGKTAPKDGNAKRKDQGGGLIVRGGPGVANRCLGLLSKMFNLAESWGLRPKASNPAKDVTRYREKPKERFLNAEEYKRLGAALHKFEEAELESAHAIAAIRLLILTGARLSEILTLEWDFVQLDNARLRLPDSKTGAKTISLPEPAVDLLRGLRRIDGNPYVISGRRHGCHLVDLQRPWQRIRQAAGVADVRIHDLRHSFASHAIQNGISLSVIGRLLGHKSSETTRRYAHFEDDYLASESEKIGKLLTVAMSDAAIASR